MTNAPAANVAHASHATGPAGSGWLRSVVGNPPMAVMIALLTIAFVALFQPWFHRQHDFSREHMQDWGHAYAIPLISAYLIWQRRREIASVPIAAFWPGLAPMLCGMVCYVFFMIGASSNHMFQGFAIILTLFGLLLLLLGPAAMRFLFLPIAYLVFAVTISEKIMLMITFRLQLVAAQGAGAILTVIGKLWGVFTGDPFFTDVSGNTLVVTPMQGAPIPLDIAEACSGMRMVVAFIALGGAVALFACRFWWQRTALLLLAAPVAVLMNVLRVVILGLLSLVDPRLAAGDAHMFIGTVLLLPGLGLFMLVVWALNRAVGSTDGAGEAAAPKPAGGGGPTWLSLRRPSFLVALGLLAAAAGTTRAAVQAYGIYLKKLPIEARDSRKVHALPIDTVSWRRDGTDEKLSAEMVETLGTTNYVTRRYVPRAAAAPRGMSISLHMAYYTGMIDTVPHVPERCMVGAGWTQLKDWGEIAVPLKRDEWREDSEAGADPRGPVMTVPLRNAYGAVVERVRLPRGVNELKLRVSEFQGPNGGRMLSGYFFIANGAVVASAEGVRLLAFNLTDDYAYYLKVQFGSVQVATAEELASAVGSLLDDLLPEIARCVPDWTLVQRGEFPPDNPRRGSAGAH